MKTLGQFIRETRDERDVSLREFAKMIDCSAAFLSDIELGRRNPSDEVFERIANKLKISLKEIKQYDNRPVTDDLREKIQTDPRYAFAFRTVLESNVTAEDLITFVKKHKKK